MKRVELTRRLRSALLVEPELAVLPAAALESVDFEAIADELIAEIEAGVPS